MNIINAIQKLHKSQLKYIGFLPVFNPWNFGYYRVGADFFVGDDLWKASFMSLLVFQTFKRPLLVLRSSLCVQAKHQQTNWVNPTLLFTSICGMGKKTLLSLPKDYQFLFHKKELTNIYILPAIYKFLLLQDCGGYN